MKKVVALALLLSGLALAQDAKPELSAGDTAWIIVASALVMLMTPGLAFFYGGLVRGKSVLNTMMMSFIALGVVTLLWVTVGYSLTFASGGNALIGSLANLGLAGLSGELSGSIPAMVFAAFQGMFPIITVALISGAVVDRMKFGAFVLFAALWMLLVYVPLAHWVWSADGWLFKLGALDFAGGTVVHISAGVSGLVLASVLGPRLGSTLRASVPHNVPFVLLGAALLWFGWFGFNAGSALAAGQTAGLAFMTTHIATAAAMLVWLLLEVARGHKPSAVGAATGAVVGLVAITPACAFVSPVAAIAVGGVAAACAFAMVQLKSRFRADDALDVFACHGVGGIVGAVLTGALAFTTGSGKGTLEQIGIQLISIVAAMALAAVGTFVIARVIDLIMGLRVSAQQETLGLDLAAHQEEGYASGDLGYAGKDATPLGTPVILSSSD
ncbi:Amt family ammonium transporter [Deinobacterium chartae]|uniref:Ammonium transporter n=1 Tax=Deinobacterium chartae TaxID=521158 RepID=A0A841I1G2_9DEIO|nr:ammonium transporter [Deinobacterium chartae]MBB6098270.1 Amt family ammonium transporter [Deinobacterium chartae]